MKKKIILLLCLLLLGAIMIPMLAGCTPRDQVLKVYNVSEYLDEDLIDDFKEYYEQITGEKIKVKYKTFDTNESMFTKIASKKSDYDVICPSDYMVERMRKESLLLPLAEDLTVYGEGIEDYRGGISDFFKGHEFDPENKYSAPYMWGTMGILYNKNLLKAEHKTNPDAYGHPEFVRSWDALFTTDSHYKDKIAMKNSVRDTYAIAAIKTYKNDIFQNGVVDAAVLETKINATDATSIAAIKTALINQKKSSTFWGYEVDEGKQLVIDGRLAMSLQWGGDAVWAIYEEGKDNLDYVIPDEGSNFFIDAWCIPRYAKNERAAQLWINFMCRDDVAIANMDYIGYTTCIGTEAVLDWVNNEYKDWDFIDLSYIFGEAGAAVRADHRQYPAKEVIDRCAMMYYFGDEANISIEDMWSEVKNSR